MFETNLKSASIANHRDFESFRLRWYSFSFYHEMFEHSASLSLRRREAFVVVAYVKVQDYQFLKEYATTMRDDTFFMTNSSKLLNIPFNEICSDLG